MKEIVFLSIILSFLPCFVKNEEVLAPGNTSASITSRILGGLDADITVFPYQLSLRLNRRYVCSAVRIKDDEALTAAHCITHMPGMIWPYFNANIHGGTASSIEYGVVYTIRSIKVHPGWTGTIETACNHDIAYIKLNEKSTESEVENIAVFPEQDIVSHSTGLVSGWGYTDLTNPHISPILKYLVMLLVRYDECQQFMLDDLVVNLEQICAFQTAGHGCCKGDSGAPLVSDYVILGLHSSTRAGYEGAGQEAEFFTNVFRERDFIDLARQIP